MENSLENTVKMVAGYSSRALTAREMSSSSIPPHIPIVPGTVAKIYHDEAVPMPYLQVIYAKNLEKETGNGRWKVALSDSQHFIHAVALSNIASLFETKQIEPGHVVKVLKYSMANVKGHYIMLVGELDPSQSIKLDGKLGDPTNVELLGEGGAKADGKPAQQTTNAPAYNPPVAAPSYNPPTASYHPPAQPTSYMNQPQQHTAYQPAPSYAPPPTYQPQAPTNYAPPTPVNHAPPYVPPASSTTYQPPQAQQAPQFRPPQAQPSYQPPPMTASPYGQPTGAQYSSYNGRPAGMATAEPVYAANPYGAPQPYDPSATGAHYTGGNQTGMNSDESVIYTPIVGLSPYQNTFVLKARVSFKSDIKSWAKEKTSGKLFSVNLVDQTGEIRMTGFKDAVDMFYDLLQVGQVYSISNVAVKMANRRYSNVNNDYELVLESGSQIRLLQDTTGMPTERYSFIPVNQLGDCAKDQTIDIIGVAHDVSDLGSITVKSTGKQLSKRDLTLVDKTGYGVRLTLWGKEAEDFANLKDRAVLAFKHVRVSDYNGRTLSTLPSSSMNINPDIAEAHDLRGWYDSVGYNQTPMMMSQSGAVGGSGASTNRDERKPISAIKDENMGTREKPDYITVVATVSYIRSEGNIYYMACPGEGCSKKVVDDGPGMYRCERCQKVYDRCEYRYILSCQISDESGQTWINVFNETGAAILGVTAEELSRMKGEDEEEYKKVFERAQLQSFLLRLRIKQEMYQGEAKIRNTLVSAVPVPWADESKRLIEKIQTVL